MLRQKIINLISNTFVVFVCFSMIFLFSCSPKEEKEADTKTDSDTEQTVVAETPETEAEATPQIEASNAIAVIETAKGNIEFEFMATEAPNASKNFIKNASKGYYKTSSFHTVEDHYVQAGSDLIDDTLPFEKSEHALEKGVVVQVASEEGASDADGEEFLICKSVVELEDDFTVLGKVISGLEVLDSIEKDDKIVNITIRERETVNETEGETEDETESETEDETEGE